MIFLQLIGAFLSVAAVAAARNHIIEGKPSAAHSKPWLMPIFRDPELPAVNDISHCAASLLRVSPDKEYSDIALTAAHCIGIGGVFKWFNQPCYNKTRLFKRHVVIAGAHTLKDASKGRAIEIRLADGQCPEDWSPKRNATTGHQNDIAILKLETPLNFSETIQPIELPKRGDMLKAGTVCSIAGWGVAGFRLPQNPDDTAFGSEQLLELDAEIVPDDECAKLTPTDLFVPEKMGCSKAARGSKGHACTGDSGGALVCNSPENKPTQYGVLSYGSKPCSDAPDVMVYTDIQHYLDWVEGEVKRLSALI